MNVRIQKQPSGILAARLLSLLSVRLTVMLCFTALSAKTVEFVFLLCVSKNVFFYHLSVSMGRCAFPGFFCHSGNIAHAAQNNAGTIGIGLECFQRGHA